MDEIPSCRGDGPSPEPHPNRRIGARAGPGSGASGATEVVEGQLAGGLSAALCAAIDMAPRSEQTRAFGVEQHDEGLRYRIDVESEVGAPTGGRRVAVQVQAL